MSAYLYYRCDTNVIDDGEYDKLSLYVAKNWDKLDTQLQWQLVDADTIRATGSGILITQMGVGAALAWYKKKKNKNLKGYSMDWMGPHPEFNCLYAVI
jgi:hypothetical protein